MSQRATLVTMFHKTDLNGWPKRWKERGKKEAF